MRSVYEGEWDGTSTRQSIPQQARKDQPNRSRQGAARVNTRANVAIPGTTGTRANTTPPNEPAYSGQGQPSIQGLLRKAGVDYRNKSRREIGGDDRVASTTDGQPSRPVGGPRRRRSSTAPVSRTKKRAPRKRTATRERRPQQGGLEGLDAALTIEPAVREVRRRDARNAPPPIRGTR